MIQPAAAQHRDIIVNGLADPADRRLGDTGVAPEGFDQVDVGMTV
jgi:hypothetical protein